MRCVGSLKFVGISCVVHHRFDSIGSFSNDFRNIIGQMIQSWNMSRQSFVNAVSVAVFFVSSLFLVLQLLFEENCIFYEFQGIIETFLCSLHCFYCTDRVFDVVTTTLELVLERQDFYAFLNHGRQSFSHVFLESVECERRFIRNNVHIFWYSFRGWKDNFSNDW